MTEGAGISLPDGYIYQTDLANGFLGRSIILECTHTKQSVLCKVVELSRIGGADRVEKFISFVQQVQSINHPSVVPFTEIIRHDTKILLMRPFIEGFPLMSQIETESPVTRFNYWRKIVSVIRVFHDNNIGPTFIRPSNIFITADKSIFITDIYQPIHDGTLCLQNIGTSEVGLLAPEFFTGAPAPSLKSDIYSLGMLLIYILTDIIPFNTRNMFSMMQQIAKGRDGFVYPVPKCIESIIDVTCVADPNKRESCDFLLEQNPLLTQIDKKVAPVQPSGSVTRILSQGSLRMRQKSPLK